MIREVKKDRALRSIHDLLVEARILAFENISSEEMAEYLAKVEYLMVLIIEEEDNTDIYAKNLQKICAFYDYKRIMVHYNAPLLSVDK